jgi:transposase
MNEQQQQRRKRRRTTGEERKSIVDMYIAGSGAATISEELSMKRTTVLEIIKTYANENRVKSKKRGKQKEKVLDEEHKRMIIEWLNNDCAMTLKQIQEELKKLDVLCSTTTINKCITEFFYTFKRVSREPDERNSTRTIQLRHDYVKSFHSLQINHREHTFVFVDEVGFQVVMRPFYGRSKKGTRARIRAPRIRSRNISMCVAMHSRGIIANTITTSTYTSTNFEAFIMNVFNKLNDIGIDSAVIVLDNARFHHSQNIHELFTTSRHHLLFLPPYSPMLNPIEYLFSKIKNSVRRASCKDEAQLMNAIRNAVTSVTATDCEDCLGHSLLFFDQCENNEPLIGEHTGLSSTMYNAVTNINQ